MFPAFYPWQLSEMISVMTTKKKPFIGQQYQEQCIIKNPAALAG
jgi:hypothetical protein